MFGCKPRGLENTILISPSLDLFPQLFERKSSRSSAMLRFYFFDLRKNLGDLTDTMVFSRHMARYRSALRSDFDYAQSGGSGLPPSGRHYFTALMRVPDENSLSLPSISSEVRPIFPYFTRKNQILTFE